MTALRVKDSASMETKALGRFARAARRQLHEQVAARSDRGAEDG